MSTNASFSPARFPALRTNADEVSLKTRAAGHAAGYAAGLRVASEELADRLVQMDEERAALIAEGQAQIATALAVLQAASEALNRRTIPLLTESQDAIAATALELAEAIIGRELSDGETSARSALQRALAEVDTKLVQTVRLNPEDLTVLGEDALAIAGVSFIPDVTLDRGDAITEFADGFLDARIATALQRAKSAIAGEEL